MNSNLFARVIAPDYSVSGKVGFVFAISYDDIVGETFYGMAFSGGECVFVYYGEVEDITAGEIDTNEVPKMIDTAQKWHKRNKEHVLNFDEAYKDTALFFSADITDEEIRERINAICTADMYEVEV